MIRIFRDSGTGEYIVQTTCLDVNSFIPELAEAISRATTQEENSPEIIMSILTNSMPIAFKLAGYKADTVSEQRTLVCGTMSPDSCELISAVGK